MRYSNIDFTRLLVDDNGVAIHQQFKSFFTKLIDTLNASQEGQVSLADDEYLTLEANAGYGFCMIGDSQEYASFTFTSAGVVEGAWV